MSAAEDERERAMRERIVHAWRYRVSLFCHPRPTAEEVAQATGATVEQVRRQLRGLVANGEGVVNVE